MQTSERNKAADGVAQLIGRRFVTGLGANRRLHASIDVCLDRHETHGRHLAGDSRGQPHSTADLFELSRHPCCAAGVIAHQIHQLAVVRDIAKVTRTAARNVNCAPDEIGWSDRDHVLIDEADRDLVAAALAYEKLAPVVLLNGAATLANELLDPCLIE